MAKEPVPPNPSHLFPFPCLLATGLENRNGSERPRKIEFSGFICKLSVMVSLRKQSTTTTNVRKCPRAMEFNAWLLTRSQSIERLGIMSHLLLFQGPEPTQGTSGLSSSRQTSLLLGRPHPVLWVPLLTRCWWLSNLSSPDLSPALKTNEPTAHWPSPLGHDTGPSSTACPKPTLTSPRPDPPLLNWSAPQGDWYHHVSNNTSQNPRNHPWPLLLPHLFFSHPFIKSCLFGFLNIPGILLLLSILFTASPFQATIVLAWMTAVVF